ncbi:MAG: hydroxymethylbilane synthase [Pyrinomonadaceae bacterium]
MTQTITIGTRGSKLALWQAEWVRGELSQRFPSASFELKILKTSGDIQKDVSLSVIGGQGVFTKELENALVGREIDLAVHSLKDLPTVLPDELCLGAITEREDARDALIPRKDRPVDFDSLLELSPGAIVGTSSPRRAAQLRNLRPDLSITDLRGNIDTRLAKLDAGNYDYILLACAGLRRLGWAERIGFPISTGEMLPAVGQGALGIEIRTDDETANYLSGLDHPATRAACLAERAFLRAAGGGCQLPLTAHAEVTGDDIMINGLVIDEDSGNAFRRGISGPMTDAEMLGRELALAMLVESNGATFE